MSIAFAELIRAADVEWAAELMGLGPNGFAPVKDDDSRLKAMLNMGTVDFEACPGSGKTTLLVAKLAILAMRWPSRQQGICVLSHTNAARNEIATKLSRSAAGIALGRYPHFVGTIHSFVNEFLALPWLRSKGIEVRHIDTSIALAKRWGMLSFNTRYSLERRKMGPYSLIYEQPDFSGGDKSKFGAGTPTYQAMTEVARVSTAEGYLCFDEMFVWANELLDKRPEVAQGLRQRFPLVFIDEAQDNSEEQAALLHRIFCAGDGPSCRQRFGDSNQAIYARPNLEGAATDAFPGACVHPMPRSFRFCQALANEVKGFGVHPQALVGAGPASAHIMADPKSPAIFVFDDASVRSVLPRYGEYLLANFSPTELENGVFTAVAGVHDLNDDSKVPRAMGHYAPQYDPDCTRKEAAPATFAQHLARARFEMAAQANTEQLVNAVASGLFGASMLSGGTHERRVGRSAHRRLVEILSNAAARESYSQLLDIVLAAQGKIDDDAWSTKALPLATAVIEHLSGTSPLNDDTVAFLAWPVLDPSTEEPTAAASFRDNLFYYPAEKPQVRVRLGSIHSVKGETHTATLVLDSYFHQHHLSELKPWLLGKKSGGATPNAKGRLVKESTRTLSRLRLHYVAMTRPTHLLCLAMRWGAFEAGELDTLVARGWAVIDCRKSRPGVLSPSSNSFF